MRRSIWKTTTSLTLAMGLFVPAITPLSGALAQSVPSWSGSLNGIGQSLNQELRAQQRQMRAQQRQQQREQQQAAQRERRPHAVSATYSGTLSPVANLATIVSNRTVYLETPIVANGVLTKVAEFPIYLAADGKAYSQLWINPWQINGSDICFNNNGENWCMTALSDSTGQAFFRKSNGLLVQIGKFGNGDSANSKVAFAQTQKANEQGAKATAALFGMFMSMGGGGGDSSAEAERQNRLQDTMVRQMEVNRRMNGN